MHVREHLYPASAGEGPLPDRASGLQTGPQDALAVEGREGVYGVIPRPRLAEDCHEVGALIARVSHHLERAAFGSLRTGHAANEPVEEPRSTLGLRSERDHGPSLDVTRA